MARLPIQISNSHACAFPRRDLPGLCQHIVPRRIEGAGNAGRPMRPQPRMQNKKHTSVVTTGSPVSLRHSPRNGFNGFLRALSGDRLSCHHRRPQCASIVANLTPASRRRDHTTSPSASGAFVTRAAHVHRIPHPTFVTIGQTPLLVSARRMECALDFSAGSTAAD